MAKIVSIRLTGEAAAVQEYLRALAAAGLLASVSPRGYPNSGTTEIRAYGQAIVGGDAGGVAPAMVVPLAALEAPAPAAAPVPAPRKGRRKVA